MTGELLLSHSLLLADFAKWEGTYPFYPLRPGESHAFSDRTRTESESRGARRADGATRHDPGRHLGMDRPSAPH